MMRLDHFSLLAPFYDRMTDGQDMTQLQTLLALPTAGRLLDAGGGTGRVAHMLRDMAGQVVVSDEASGMLRQAAQKNGLTPLQAHAETLPFAAGSFDRIVVVDAFHHFSRHRQAVAEFWRVLAPGGRVVIEEPNIETWPVKVVALAEKLMLMRSHIYAPGEIKAMFETHQAQVTIHTDQQHTIWVVAQK
jgi:ubiquinone/menaquinone biosynthesis C-methylase UbiE